MSSLPPPRHADPPSERGPTPERLAGLLARSWLEVRAGRRPVAQLLPLVAPVVQRRLVAQLPPPHARRATPARVHRVITSSPSANACEATVLVEQGGRITALAIRLERQRDAWRVVDLTAPEAGLAPLSRDHDLRDRFDAMAPPMTG